MNNSEVSRWAAAAYMSVFLSGLSIFGGVLGRFLRPERSLVFIAAYWQRPMTRIQGI